MNTAIAQSATQLAVSANGETSFDFALAASKAAKRSSKGVTRERQMLDRNKLISSVCAEYRAAFVAIYGKSDRLPSDIFEKIKEHVDAYINKQLSTVHAGNVISHRRAFYHDHKNMAVTERVINTGENTLTLKEQLFGVNMFITQAEKRLQDLMAKKTPDYDREKATKEQILRLQCTKSFIEGEIAHQAKVTTPQIDESK